MTPSEVRHASAELDLVRKRRELAFWTMSTVLSLVVLVAMVVAFIAHLLAGYAVDPAAAAVGAALTGTAGAGSRWVLRG